MGAGVTYLVFMGCNEEPVRTKEQQIDSLTIEIASIQENNGIGIFSDGKNKVVSAERFNYFMFNICCLPSITKRP